MEYFQMNAFRVHLENGFRIIAYTAGKIRRFHIRSVARDRVQIQIEMLPYDLKKGVSSFVNETQRPRRSTSAAVSLK